ncbi:leucine-rich repeat-containing protein 4 [Plakobranchus ocellatus]|uniref:Leucine-rich repeat-containing protein 4 n=1 Tax=Plakobranchus ocellatus TaxID=259542 RepID=A0AAV3YQM5_9GAST|nr:leucine-rich repeat-containing protein 4 [Plakobranchus ocellatus]
MEWKILLTAFSILLILLLEIEAVCVGPQCHALGERSAPINRKARSDSTVHCPKNCECNSTSSTVNCKAADLFDIPIQASVLQNTYDLHLGYNRIAEISSGAFSHMKHLRLLDVTQNRIRTIDSGAFKGLTELRVLHLDWNRIKRIPKNVFNGADLPQLINVTLEKNDLESIESETFSNMSHLDAIDLSRNMITHISQDAFNGLPILSKLDLSHNLLTSTAWVIGNANSLQSLQWLNIQNNRLKALPTNTLASLPKISTLHLDLNPWICDENLTMVYDAWILQQNRDNDLFSWFCKNPQNLNETMRVADSSNVVVEGAQTHPTNDRADLQQSHASPGFGHSQPTLVITGICTGVAGLVRCKKNLRFFFLKNKTLATLRSLHLDSSTAKTKLLKLANIDFQRYDGNTIPETKTDQSRPATTGFTT